MCFPLEFKTKTISYFKNVFETKIATPFLVVKHYLQHFGISIWNGWTFHYTRVVPELEILTILPDRTSKSIIVNVQPHPVQRPFWQASLFHLPPKFTN